MRVRRALGVCCSLVASVVLGGCAGASPSLPEAAMSVTSDPPPGSATDPSSGSAAAQGAGASVTPSSRTLTLTLDGLSTGGESLDFGDDRAEATQVLTEFVGPVTVTAQPECGQGPRTVLAAGGVQLLFADNRFTGWFVDERTAAKLTLVDGLGVGSSIEDVQHKYELLAVEGSTLGHEFSTADGSFGVLQAQPGGKVSALWAGETCFFR